MLEEGVTVPGDRDELAVRLVDLFRQRVPEEAWPDPLPGRSSRTSVSSPPAGR